MYILNQEIFVTQDTISVRPVNNKYNTIYPVFGVGGVSNKDEVTPGREQHHTIYSKITISNLKMLVSVLIIT